MHVSDLPLPKFANWQLGPVGCFKSSKNIWGRFFLVKFYLKAISGFILETLYGQLNMHNILEIFRILARRPHTFNKNQVRRDKRDKFGKLRYLI